jgi:ATP-binding cassette subfamily C (CFTR/MRP) protein 4
LYNFHCGNNFQFLLHRKWYELKLKSVAILSESFSFLEIHVSKVGLTIMQAIKMSGQIPYLMKSWSDVETQMTSVERLVEYSKIIPERNVATCIPSKFWPTAGNIKFESVSMKYSADGPLVLKEVSFEINSGEKIGIVGRTGAGKSSLISCLFRLFDFDGTIFIDGVNIKELDLNTLRSKITIISQEPISFSGTLRKNLDPLNEYNDRELWNALEEVELKTSILKLNGGLDTVIAENGSNFSLGQRQLFCLVRAFLRRNNIIILDEATASIDYKTDQVIQSVIKRKFEDRTVLTIAHRITTVMDSDKILIMDAGSLTKFDHASNVFKNEYKIKQ